MSCSATDTRHSPPRDAFDVRCAIQVLVIDRPNGPADILMDIVGRLADQEVSLVSVSGRVDALRALQTGCFDLAVLGLEGDRPPMLEMIATIRLKWPKVPVVVIGDRLSPHCVECIRNYGARAFAALPDRVQDLKALVRRMLRDYFQATAQAAA